MEGDVLATLARATGDAVVFVARDGARLKAAENALGFFAPELPIVRLPAWDCMPYDRASPSALVQARRASALAMLAERKAGDGPLVVLTTANAILQRAPRPEVIRSATLKHKAGADVAMKDVLSWLEDNAFLRTPTVREAGEYAVRGGIVDLFAPGTEQPVRLDFFGDTLETIRPFDAETQRTTGQWKAIELIPMSEVILNDETISRFREGYLRRFGAAGKDDILYHSVSEGVRASGVEHWMPLFHEGLATAFDYMPGAPCVIDHLAEDAIAKRVAEIEDHYATRLEAKSSSLQGAPYNPLPPGELYLAGEPADEMFDGRRVIRLSPFDEPEKPGQPTIPAGGKVGRSFAAERSAGNVNIFSVLSDHVNAVRQDGRRVVIASWSEGSRSRMAQVLHDHELKRIDEVASMADVLALEKGHAGLAVIELETGFETPDYVVVAEQDVLGDRLVSSGRRRKRDANALTEAASLAPGDLVVHVDHGIGRFIGLKTLEAAGAPHDCVEIAYLKDDKLYLPVENIDLLSRYGAAEADGVILDKLGGAGWQARKAKMKERVREIADGLIKTAAQRMLKKAPVIMPPSGVYDEFVAKFPYNETDDQLSAIEAVAEDLAAGRPMDRLVCGDVGFGKTEVAIRAAFLAAMDGKQVALIVPTTLLARQHYKTFAERFAGLPLRVEQMSRLVSSKQMREVKAGLTSGDVDIVVGTHALLAKGIEFRDLGLLIVDEEQKFGVKHKEKLKELKADVHVLTLSATPIPRTMQLALTGVRELSLIATPPVDRLTVRTFVTPFDALTIREALLRERYRGGQSFYVCPRVSDLAGQKEFLEQHVPEVKVAVAHGQMSATDLDDVMNAFYDGQYDVLLATTIVESGLDIPTANTLVVHRADMFGLAQLYQIRGRVGRSKTRAYALMTTPVDKTLTGPAQRRLKVLSSLDTLGAGFQLASHDLDIRGAGNLLGEEQSGHIKEVGFELYQSMLEEAVATLKSGSDEEAPDQWSPHISVGIPVLIPEDYIPDLQLRMSLYRRLADLDDARSIDAFGAELVDRFGPVPDEVEWLMKIVYIKSLCRKANVEKIDAGPKGCVISFRNNEFDNAQGLVQMIAGEGSLAKMRPDQKIVFIRDWPDADKRTKGVAVLLAKLAKLAEAEEKAAA
ncbi:transcription-repair coupling factor [Acuticoccus sediminis]|uniref:Transcription-repair-coupling factor n=1 Tax=Acuticoccus sediminis TaxID=2184697 RepID=A0A8B2NL32_9HYPH|nr:transcription-repair coupling factor [Acuticoccus sediminis]RAI00315.1 transcription-repair coupling factor [Acuticoccus sediminis]